MGHFSKMKRDCRDDATPRLELQLSSQLLLTLSSASSKLPTLTWLPFELTDFTHLYP